MSSVYTAGDTAARAGRAFQIPGVYSLSGRIIHGWLHSADKQQSSSSSSSSSSMDGPEAATVRAIPEVQLDEGTFKYVLLRITDIQGATKVPFTHMIAHTDHRFNMA